MSVGNDQNVTFRMDAGLYANGRPIALNDTAIPPKTFANITMCVGPVPRNNGAPFVVKIFGSSKLGTITPQYPVTVVNSTNIAFSDQFYVSNELRSSVYNKTFGVNMTIWTPSITNTGQQPIDFLYAFLTNGSAPLLGSTMRCAGSPYPGNGAPELYSQPLLPGQTATYSFTYSTASSLISPGKTYNVIVIAIYANNSEVVRNISVQATA